MPQGLSLLIQAGNPLIAIETADEARAQKLVHDAALDCRRNLFEWSMTRGIKPVETTGNFDLDALDAKAVAALEWIRDLAPDNSIYIFKDLAPHGKDAQLHRTLRDILPKMPEWNATIVLVESQPIPVELRRLTVLYEIGWPSHEELEEVVKSTFNKVRRASKKEVVGNVTRRDVEQIVQTLRGLSCDQAERVVAAAIYHDLCLTANDIAKIVEAKRTLLGTTGCLEAIAVDINIEEVAGLRALKAWLKQRRGGYTREAREFGLEPPRGVLMLGVPGCGKSLCAKAVAADWNMPLLRLDPGVLYQKYIGESESQLRRALSQAEAMAPVVLWIDEIEKAFASASEASADGGLSKRMFGTLLSWMQDHRHPIFTIATANDVSALPPELMRKGRFDEVFFIDLPSRAVRQEVLSIHLKKRNRDPHKFDLSALADATEGYSGSELEQVVISGLFEAFSAKSELADQHLVAAVNTTKPLSGLAGEKVEALREWASGRCVDADAAAPRG
ncbi:ATPase [Planctomyces sp. SCGC AG-212-M04]|nr:ATPase [Planctomyces sp. SCGC AG-212-M04]